MADVTQKASNEAMAVLLNVGMIESVCEMDLKPLRKSIKTDWHDGYEEQREMFGDATGTFCGFAAVAYYASSLGRHDEAQKSMKELAGQLGELNTVIGRSRCDVYGGDLTCGGSLPPTDVSCIAGPKLSSKVVEAVKSVKAAIAKMECGPQADEPDIRQFLLMCWLHTILVDPSSTGKQLNERIAMVQKSCLKKTLDELVDDDDDGIKRLEKMGFKSRFKEVAAAVAATQKRM
eukprot:CAMPEP_0119117192 /NCGR_PEP_ID=MMETSP1180-20130426/52701_1 /TAXON_ID=3052 ORGANISM="Chlamydomonas cf sp, Strain CCMP681" /NCGR_SAMPLE_ID=MMETSP1180 /ASSEMBLY_ACC=CAM_ASM_000741 /LENGTH=232 /DNA_ID=CAMNT_0007106423 /DNA_START=72 /DNA_END=770 /DNA_ORIENTATION=+